MEKIKLLVAIPSSRDWKFGFGVSLTHMIFHLFTKGVNGQPIEFNVISANGASCLPPAREGALQAAIDSGFSHIFMADDDMEFPRDALDYLFKHNVPVVAANACKKLKGKPQPIAQDFKGRYINSKYKKGIEKVHSVGVCAFGLIDIGAIKHVPRPRFEIPYIPSADAYLGEDLYFCRKLQTYGVDIHIDHDLSKKVKHIGDYGYGYN